MNQILGGHSALMKLILKLMFVDGVANFTKGCFIVHEGVERLLTAGFGGILADEKALKEFFDIKGQAGTKPCIQCQNLENFLHKRSHKDEHGYVISLACADRSRWISHTNNSVYKMVDRLREADPRDRHDLSQLFGVNHNPHGMLSCLELRSIVKPIDHYCRDWQHTLLSSGVAGSHVAGLLTAVKKSRALKRAGITLDTMRQYASHFILPRTRPKLNENWFHNQFLENDHVKVFASDVLTIIPILVVFMLDVVAPSGMMQDHIKAIVILGEIMAVLQHAEMIEPIYERLRSIIDEHQVLFIKLYGHPDNSLIKVKFHHLGHLPEDLLRLTKNMSCFPTERKHRDWKSACLHVFRNVEHTTTCAFLNFAMQEYITGRFRFEECYLDDPENFYVGGTAMQIAKKAHCPCGLVLQGDIILAIEPDNHALIVGMVIKFVALADQQQCACAQIEKYKNAAGNTYLTDSPASVFVGLETVRSNLTWAKRGHGRIKVLAPICFLHHVKG